MINFRVAQAPLAPNTCLVSSRLWRGEKGLPSPSPEGSAPRLLFLKAAPPIYCRTRK